MQGNWEAQAWIEKLKRIGETRIWSHVKPLRDIDRYGYELEPVAYECSRQDGGSTNKKLVEGSNMTCYVYSYDDQVILVQAQHD